MAPLVEHQIYFTSGITFINTDIEYLNTHCKNKIGITFCKQTQPIHDRTSQHDCQSEVINFANSINKCKLVVYKINTISFIPLKTSNQYIAIPEQPLELNVICGKEHTIKKLTTTSLLRSNQKQRNLYHKN